MRVLFVIHRWGGIVMGPLMLLWCLTGAVMLYAPYPALDPAQRQAGLAPLNLAQCCNLPAEIAAGARVEMMAGRPVLRQRGDTVDLTNGRLLMGISPAEARAVADAYAAGNHIAGGVTGIDSVTRDQWTVSGAFNRDRPLYRARFGDEAGTELYISGRDGAARQVTTRAGRFWAMLGAVPHWLYIVPLRRNPALWTQMVIWTALAGTFLTALGLYLGVRQALRARRGGQWSPYRGFHWWHHVPGLLFGVMLLSWVLSGLLSMNPWGLLEDMGVPQYAETQNAAHFAAALKALSNGAVSIEAAPLHSRLYLIRGLSDGRRVRVDAVGRPAPLSVREWPGATLLAAEDDYYFPTGEDAAPLPVFRMLDGDEHIYRDVVSGAVVRRIGPQGRLYRWLFQAPHRLDFAAILRARPLWDIVVILLLAGASLVSATGMWLGVRHLIAKR